MNLKRLMPAVAAGAIVLPSAAFAGTGSVIYGLDLRAENQFFTTTTDDFIGNFSDIAFDVQYDSFALDMTLDALTMYAVRWDGGTTTEYGTIDIATGAYNALGLISGPAQGTNVSGLSVDPITGDWYMSTSDTLWRGDISTGTFEAVGLFGGGALIIDIAIDSQGNAYGHDINGDVLTSINLATGESTAIGATGMAANFAQGMDFDYSTDMLYATVYTGGGTGGFGTFDLATGAFNMLQDTAVLNIEAEMAVGVAIPAPGALAMIGLGLLGGRRRRG